MSATSEKPVTRIRLKRGLDLPFGGVSEPQVLQGPPVTQVALVGDDYVDMKPTMFVSVGDRVAMGQPVFADKKTPGVQFTAPAAGEVIAIHRGAKRKFESLVIQVDGDSSVSFASFRDMDLGSLGRDQVTDNLVSSGIWPAFRTRPYSKVPTPTTTPHSIFVTAMDTNPLAPNPALVLQQGENQRYFMHGLRALQPLTKGSVYVCHSASDEIPVVDSDRIQYATFSGPHPAGLVGTHIHFLDPVNAMKTVWHIGYQDVVAIGALFLDGRFLNTRFISIGGPGTESQRIVSTQLGARICDLTSAAPIPNDVRLISGSVLSGRTIREPIDFLGRYHLQVTAIPNGGQREILGWAMPGASRFSASNAFLSALFGRQSSMPFTTSMQGSKRAIVPIGAYERVLPLDIVATPLLKALTVQDTDTLQMLGCLELDEEDLALCTFVCPGKGEYGHLLREALSHIEREG